LEDERLTLLLSHKEKLSDQLAQVKVPIALGLGRLFRKTKPLLQIPGFQSETGGSNLFSVSSEGPKLGSSLLLPQKSSSIRFFSY